MSVWNPESCRMNYWSYLVYFTDSKKVDRFSFKQPQDIDVGNRIAHMGHYFLVIDRIVDTLHCHPISPEVNFMADAIDEEQIQINAREEKAWDIWLKGQMVDRSIDDIKSLLGVTNCTANGFTTEGTIKRPPPDKYRAAWIKHIQEVSLREKRYDKKVRDYWWMRFRLVRELREARLRYELFIQPRRP